MTAPARERCLTAAEQTTNQHVMGLETTWRREYRDIRKILDCQYSARSKVLSYLNSMGLTTESPPEVVPQSLQTQGRAKRKTTLQQLKSNIPAAPTGTDWGPAIPTTYSCAGGLSAKLLSERVLPCLDRVSLSCANAKAFTRGMSAEMAKHELRKVLEFITGQVPDSLRFVERFRFWKPVIELLQSCSQERGRAARFEFGCDWGPSGVYALGEHNGSLQVRHRYRKDHVTLKPEELHLSFTSLSDFFLEKNWSETQAEIRSVQELGSKSGFRVGGYFETHAAAVPCRKKRKPALMDEQTSLERTAKVPRKTAAARKPESSSSSSSSGDSDAESTVPTVIGDE